MFRPQNNSSFKNIKQAEIYYIDNTKQNERNEMHLKKNNNFMTFTLKIHHNHFAFIWQYKYMGLSSF